MGRQPYSPEFREEAVRQVTERNASVRELAERLDISARSLCKWVNGVKQDK